MGLRDSLRSLVTGPGPAPGPAPGAPAARQDATDGSSRYMGSIYNTLTGYGGQSDKGSAARPNTYRQGLSLDELESLYAYNAYAGRVVDQLADDATRKGWVVKDDEGESDPLSDEIDRLDVAAKFCEAIKWARLYGGSGVLIITDEDTDALSTPLDPKHLRKITNLTVLDAWEMSPATYETDPHDPRYRDVATWYVYPAGRAAGVTAEVHASRMLYFFGRKLSPSQRWGGESGLDQSVLDQSWDAVRNLTSVDQGGASVAQQIMVGVLKMSNLGAKQASDQRANFLERIALVAKTISALNMVVLSPEEDYATRSASVSGWKDLSEQARLSLAAVTGMPQTLLFGETPGGLSTDGDSHRKIWAAVVSAYQAFAVRPQAHYLTTLIYAQTDGPTKGVEPESWKLEFRPLDEPTRKEKADTEKVHAETDQIRINTGVVDPEHVARSRFGSTGYGDELLPLEEEDIEEASADVEAEAAGDAALLVQDAEDTYAVPEAARGNARKVLRWREEHPDEIQGMTDVGWARARQLASQARVGLSTVKRMASFNSHRKNAEVAPEHDGEPWKDAGYVAWLGWGGTTGVDWARGITGADKQDADPAALCLLIPVPAGGLDEHRRWKAEAEALVGPLEHLEQPHVTVLFLGQVPEGLDAEVVEIARDIAEDFVPERMTPEGTMVLGNAVVLRHSAWHIERLHAKLLQGLAHVVTQRQYPAYRPHETLGYSDALTPEAAGRVLELQRNWTDDPPKGWVAARLEIRRGDKVVATLPFLGKREDGDAADKGE